MLSAIASLRNNRALLKKRKIREVKDLLYEISGKTELEFKEMSPYEFAALKSEIRKRARKEATAQRFYYFMAFMVAFLIFLFLYWLFELDWQ